MKKYKPQYLKDLVYNFKTTYPEGYTMDDYSKLLQQFPKINMSRFNDALTGITCTRIDNKPVIYHCDILLALTLGIEDRDMKSYEFD